MLTEAIQMQVLFSILDGGVRCRYGWQRDFETIQTYRDFIERTPIVGYEDLESDIEAMKSGREDLLWPGKVDRYAVSAGTTGEGKHLPLTDGRMLCDRKFMQRIAWKYFKKHPNPFTHAGTYLSLPGTVEQKNGILLGEISGFSATQSAWWLRPFHLDSPKKLAFMTFREKFDRVYDKALQSDLHGIIAVPSWILTLFQRALEQTGKSSVAEIWPNLELIVAGGVKLANYRSHLDKLADGLDIDYIETYGASEGYFGFSGQPGDDDLELVYDNGVFYEFIPNPLPDPDSLPIQEAVPLWEVETDLPYAMVVTTNAGLWRYGMNDVVTFTSVDPPRIKVSGRISEMLDEYGEALHIQEAEQALKEASKEIGKETTAFSIASVLSSEHDLPHHRWFVQFSEPVHTDTLKRMAAALDDKIREMNRHYAIRRESNALGQPTIQSITQSDINAWLDYSGRHSAQGKLPRVLRDEDDLEFFSK